MKNIFSIIACLTIFMSSTTITWAQTPTKQRTQRDTTVSIEHVTINATRASARTPLTYSNLDRQAINRLNTGAMDLPFLLLTTPSVVVTSDAGSGVGYTSIRIRGTDPSRINVTANDIPTADAESHSQFWVNVPDLASSIEDMQVQRGVGSSTNGAGAFGGSINIRTAAPLLKPSAEIEGVYGSFNTHREMVRVGTGLLGKHFAFDARLSNVHSDGYIDRASTDLQSYFAQGAYYGKSTTVRFITFGGREKTYHAWNGIDSAQLATNRRYNPAGEIEDKDGNVIGFYEDQTDNYNQTHYQLLVDQRLAPRWDLSIKLHYTDGKGYYQEYKNGRTLLEYGLTPFEVDGQIIKKSNLVRRKQMVNGFGGGVWAVNYRAPKITVTLGGAANSYGGHHFGNVTWIKNYVGQLQPDHEYYSNHSIKNDVNVFLKADYRVMDCLSLYADVQYRHVGHTINGRNDNWDFNISQMQEINVARYFNFMNPKAGLHYQINRHNALYASFAIAHKEPTRNNYTDATEGITPRAERLMDTELGYKLSTSKVSAEATLYYMSYKDQLVLTGRTNDIGEPLTENVERSFRAGVELSLGWQIIPCLRLDLTGTFSRNRILDYKEYLDNYDENYEPLYTQTRIAVGNTDISFSPSITAAGSLSFNMRGWGAWLTTQYVSKQYLNNAMQERASLAAYSVSNLNLSYTFRSIPVLRDITLALAVNNIFNKMYSSNGWASNSFVTAADGTGHRDSYAGYFPQAGTNVMARVAVRF
ncbi:MAG: TonB-dependent receptor [Mucinivorans sp.]